MPSCPHSRMRMLYDGCEPDYDDSVPDHDGLLAVYDGMGNCGSHGDDLRGRR